MVLQYKVLPKGMLIDFHNYLFLRGLTQDCIKADVL